jgi:hypothetical protein
MNIRTSQREQVLARACGHVGSLRLTIVPSHFSLSVVKRYQCHSTGFPLKSHAAFLGSLDINLGQSRAAG